MNGQVLQLLACLAMVAVVAQAKTIIRKSYDAKVSSSKRQTEDEEFMACAASMMQIRENCGEGPMRLFSGALVGNEVARQQLLDNHLSETCSTVEDWNECMDNILEPCTDVDHSMINQALQMMAVHKSAFRYICGSEVEVIDRHKTCLLRTDSRPGPVQLFNTMNSECQHQPQPDRSRPLCIPEELQECWTQVVENQCGDEIKDSLGGLIDLIREGGDCSSVVHHALVNKKRTVSSIFPGVFKPFF